MKYAFALAAAAAGLASANAHAGHQQFHRRDAVATVTDWTVVTVTDVVTVYGPSPSAEPSSAAASSPAAPVVSSSSSSSAAAVQTTPVAVVSTPVATPTTLQTVTSQAPKQQPAPSSSSSAAAAPAQTSSTGSTGGSGAGNHGMQVGASVAADCTEGQPCSGDMTTYTPGVGACGLDDSQGDHADDAVALQSQMFGSLSNGLDTNKLCNKTITITNKATGETATGMIRDKCPGCSAPAGGAGIDLAPALMKKLNKGVADGRLPITWYFTD